MQIDRSGYEVLPPDECLRLLAGTRTGRLALDVGALPTVVPVRFVLADDAIVMRALTEAWSRPATQEAVVAFEADNIGASTDTRWSVLVIGVASEFSGAPPPDAGRLRPAGGIVDAGSGQRLIRLTIDLVSGRRSRDLCWAA